MSIILQALAKNQDRLIPNNPTRIHSETPQPARPRARKGGPAIDVSPIWEDTRSRAEHAAAPAQAEPRGISEIKISWVLIIVAMGCMFGMLAAFYPPTGVDARTAAAQPAEPAAADTEAADAAAPVDLQVAAAEITEAAVADVPAAEANNTTLEAVSTPGQAIAPAPAPADRSAVVRVVFRKEGGQTEPDGTYRQEYPAPIIDPAYNPVDSETHEAEAIDRDAPLAIPGLMSVNPGASSVAEVGYEEGTLYEAAPIPTVTKDAPEVKSRFKSKSIESARSGKSEEAKAAGPAPLRVEGIFWDRKRPMALINGDIVEIGSKVRDGQVVDIQQSSVTVETKGVKTVMTP